MSATLIEPVTAEPGAPTVAQVVLRTPDQLRSSALLPVMCEVTEPIRSAQVTATVFFDGGAVTVGRGHASLEGRPVARKLAVAVELNELGRSLVSRPGGTTVVLDAVVQTAGSTVLSPSVPTVVVAC